MRRIARRGVFHRQPHVADLLGHPLVDLLNVAPDRLDLIGDRGCRLREMRTTQVPVPTRQSRPVVGGRDTQELRLRVERRHVRFGKGLRRIGGAPGMEDASVIELQFFMGDVAEGIADGPTLQRTLRGRDDVDLAVQQRRRQLEQGEIGKLVLHARTDVAVLRAVAEDFTDLEARDRADQATVLRIVDVRRRRGVVRRILRRRGNVDRPLRPVLGDDFHLDDLGRAVAAVVVKADLALLAAPLLGQNLDLVVTDTNIRTIWRVFNLCIRIDDDGVRIRILLDCDIIIYGQDAANRQDCAKRESKT